MLTHCYALDSQGRLHVFHSGTARESWLSQETRKGRRAVAIYRDQARRAVGEHALKALSRESHHFHFILTPGRNPCAHDCRPAPSSATCQRADCGVAAHFTCRKCGSSSCQQHVEELDPMAMGDAR